MSDKKPKEIKNVKLSYAQFTDMDIVFPGTYYILNASGEYHFICTSDRVKAQQFIEDTYGKGMYTVVCVKLQKNDSRLESGEVSVRGKQFTKGQKR